MKKVLGVRSSARPGTPGCGVGGGGHPHAGGRCGGAGAVRQRGRVHAGRTPGAAGVARWRRGGVDAAGDSGAAAAGGVVLGGGVGCRRRYGGAGPGRTREARGVVRSVPTRLGRRWVLHACPPSAHFSRTHAPQLSFAPRRLILDGSGSHARACVPRCPCIYMSSYDISIPFHSHIASHLRAIFIPAIPLDVNFAKPTERVVAWRGSRVERNRLEKFD